MAETWLFVLARDPAGAKTRLAPVLGPAARADLAQAMLEDVLLAAASATFARRFVVTESQRVRSAAAAAGYQSLPVALSNTNGAAAEALRAAAEANVPRALVLAADLPLLAAADLEELLRLADATDIVIAPDRRRRGTNALVVSPPRAIAPAFGPDSYRRHRESAREAGLRWREVYRSGLSHDVDEPADLELVASDPALGARTATLLRATVSARPSLETR